MIICYWSSCYLTFNSFWYSFYIYFFYSSNYSSTCSSRWFLVSRIFAISVVLTRSSLIFSLVLSISFCWRMISYLSLLIYFPDFITYFRWFSCYWFRELVNLDILSLYSEISNDKYECSSFFFWEINIIFCYDYSIFSYNSPIYRTCLIFSSYIFISFY